MTAEDIMSFNAGWTTWCMTASDCYWPISNVTDLADWWESRVLIEGTLDAGGFMEEATKCKHGR